MTNTFVSDGAHLRPRNSPDGRSAPRPQTTDPTWIDLTGVDPLRLAEMRRRVATVESYIAIKTPDDHTRKRHAAALGLSVNQFLALVRAWREHGRADAISGAGASRGTPRPNGARNLPTESKEAARAVMASLGADVPHVDAVAAVEARCATLGVKAPSRSTIWNMVMAARRNAGRHHGADGIVVSRCHAKLPVEQNGGVTFPSLLLVVNTADGAVLAAAMESDETALSTVRDVVRAQDGVHNLVDIDVAAGMSDLNGTIAKMVKPSAARTATAKALGRGFGSIELIYQISRAIRPEQTLRSRKDRPLPPDDARRVILEQISIHNAARGAMPPSVSWSRQPPGNEADARGLSGASGRAGP